MKISTVEDIAKEEWDLVYVTNLLLEEKKPTKKLYKIIENFLEKGNFWEDYEGSKEINDFLRNIETGEPLNKKNLRLLKELITHEGVWADGYAGLAIDECIKDIKLRLKN